LEENLIPFLPIFGLGEPVPLHAQKAERVFRGIPASPGIARGLSLFLAHGEESAAPRSISEQEVLGERHRFEQALHRTREQIVAVQRRVEETMGGSSAGIFDAHLLLLEDPTLLGEVNKHIEGRRLNAEAVLQGVGERYSQAMASAEDEYLSERAHDLRDVVSRILRNLLGLDPDLAGTALREPAIVISHDLAPSTTASLNNTLLLGLATDTGGKTSHTAILARSLKIPAVVGLKHVSEEIHSGLQVLIDGYNGLVIVNPTDQTLFEYGQVVRKQASLHERLDSIRQSAAVTLDGTRVTLSANIESADNIEAVQSSGSEGVGLFRTEYLFINRENLPTEEEQFESYSKVAAALQPQPVIVRTLDIGGDKLLSHSKMSQDLNPFLGWRAIRFCLQERDIFKQQLRAILRASTFGNVKLMYPMISGLEEFQQASEILEECKRELTERGQTFNPQLEVGVMIEVPSAVMIADALARRVKFFSLGTNDLIQYSLAADRLNERIAHLYEPTHPAILRLMAHTIGAAHKAGIWVGVCGEMAGDPLLTPLLLALGVDELSASPSSVPSVKYLVRRLKASDFKPLAEFALNCESGTEILARSESMARLSAPELFQNQK